MQPAGRTRQAWPFAHSPLFFSVASASVWLEPLDLAIDTGCLVQSSRGGTGNLTTRQLSSDGLALAQVCLSLPSVGELDRCLSALCPYRSRSSTWPATGDRDSLSRKASLASLHRPHITQQVYIRTRCTVARCAALQRHCPQPISRVPESNHSASNSGHDQNAALPSSSVPNLSALWPTPQSPPVNCSIHRCPRCFSGME